MSQLIKTETLKLIKAYKQHKTIIVGLDFDDTIFPLTKTSRVQDRCGDVLGLIIEIKDLITICLYSVGSNQELIYKEHIMDLRGIKPEYINESPVKIGNGGKPYFNILLDDKAGLNESIEILKEFKNNINLK